MSHLKSSSVLLQRCTCTVLIPIQISLNLISPQKTHFKSFNSILGNHRSAFQPITSFLHSEMSVTDEAQDNKGFLGVL